MIEIISSWAKSLGVAIVLVSILEMILPNNKTKKYIRMILGLFIIFNIISPFINNKDKLNIASINIEDYYTNSSGKDSKKNGDENLNQTSMDEKIKILYQDELEKDIIKKIEEKGYKVKSCKVEAEIPDVNSNKTSISNNYDINENETEIIKVNLEIEGKKNIEVNEENENENNNNTKEESLENKIVTEVQKIKEIDVFGDGGKKQQDEYIENEEVNEVTRRDIQIIKMFLIEEYGVSEECLEIS